MLNVQTVIPVARPVMDQQLQTVLLVAMIHITIQLQKCASNVPQINMVMIQPKLALPVTLLVSLAMVLEHKSASHAPQL